MNILQYLARNYIKFSPVVLFIFLVITYWRLPFIFFLQDEWQTFGLVISEGLNLLLRGLGDGKIFHFIPIDNLLNYLSFNIFGLHHPLYNIVGLLIHFINGLLVLELARKIFKNQVIAVAAGIIFITSSVSSQLIMWPVVSLNILSLTFSLLAWITLLHFSYASKFKLGMVVAVFILLALLTLEYSAGILVFIPLAGMILFYKKGEFKNLLIVLLPIFILAILYIGLRLYPVFLYEETQTTKQITELNTLFHKAVGYPFRYIGQAFIPQALIQDISGFLSDDKRPPEFFFSKVSFIAGVFFVLLFLFVGWAGKYKLKDDNFFRNEVVLLLFFFCSSIPFLLIPGKAGDFSLYPPRYLYFGLVSASLLLASLLSVSKMRIKAVTMLIFIISLVYVIYNIWGNLVKSNDLYLESEIRLDILNSIKSQHPVLPSKAIFLTESNGSYYGLPAGERILPFQSGFGQTLLVWYQSTNNFPKEFFENKFLWGITEQGYKQSLPSGEGKESEGRGFGYFRNFDVFAETVKEYNIPSNSIIGYRFNSDTNEIIDTTDQVKDRLIGFKSNKKIVDQKSYSVSSPLNQKEIDFLKDEDRNTFWDSGLTYNNPQSVLINLGRQRKISQIVIDSYVNKNQDRVGYEVLVSKDGNSYTNILDAKLYPPDDKGYVNIYMRPQNVQYIEINQKGDHRFSSWIIHEISLYEAVD